MYFAKKLETCDLSISGSKQLEVSVAPSGTKAKLLSSIQDEASAVVVSGASGGGDGHPARVHRGMVLRNDMVAVFVREILMPRE